LRAEPVAPRLIRIEQDILAENDRLAAENRDHFRRSGIAAINLMSGPGSGKTTLLVRSIGDLSARLPVAVIEGDQETSVDAERIRATGAVAVQVNTGNGCHLDARMIGRALPALAPPPGALLFIENVGNLVCPAAFDLGEVARVVLLSVTEGDDKPLKYPQMFAAAHLLLITKIDLAPYVPFDLQRCRKAVRRVNPGIGILEVSAISGAGLDAWYGWLDRQRVAGSGAEPPPGAAHASTGGLR
jgi:hydrogenase nickel incorporation protein HypB